MSQAWPDYAKIGADRELSHTEDVETEEYDDGFVSQYPRYSESFLLRNLSVRLLCDEDMVRFRAWVAEYGWRPFRFFDSDDKTWRMAFIEGGSGGVDYRPIAHGECRTWEARLRVVGLPSDTTTPA